MHIVHLARGREKSLLRRHPWVFDGAIARVSGAPTRGETVTVQAHDGRVLGQGAWSPDSRISVRMWGFGADFEIDAGLIRDRVAAAAALRGKPGMLGPGNGYRLIHGESDFLPGLIVDRYGDWLVCQFLGAGAEYWREAILEALHEVIAPAGIFERSDTDARGREGLPPATGLLRGQEPPPLLEIEESGLRFLVDVRAGHKTGFYLDQRDNRSILRSVARGQRILNCFSYTGGFGIAAWAGGASEVTAIDSSGPALDLAARNGELNGVGGRTEQIEGDVFRELRTFRDRGRSFDVIVLDPPKFADTRAQVDRAARGYKDINLLAAKLLASGGLLVTFSCSGGVTTDLFQKIVADAVLDAGRDARIVKHLSAPADHPVSLAFPEGSYLKGLIAEIR